MSIIAGKGFLLTYVETEVTCPICEQMFDCSERADKAPHPVFNMKCPKCKGKITVFIPIMGGELKFWETECPKTVKRLETTTPNKVNGRMPKKKLYGVIEMLVADVLIRDNSEKLMK